MDSSRARDILGSLHSPHYDLPSFDPDAAPDDPIELFLDWLEDAATAGVSQPQAMTLATAGSDGLPDARTVLLKDADDDGFWFAGVSASPKGRQLEENPAAALTLFWRERGRQVRVRGPVVRGTAEESARDFRARHPFARAQAMAGDESEPMPEASEVARRMSEAERVIEEDDHHVPADWVAYRVVPTAVDFWQAAGHDQLRVRFLRGDDGWRHDRVWP
jgi:pyridoxamine 5'-phosphate oxidase